MFVVFNLAATRNAVWFLNVIGRVGRDPHNWHPPTAAACLARVLTGGDTNPGTLDRSTDGASGVGRGPNVGNVGSAGAAEGGGGGGSEGGGGGGGSEPPDTTGASK